MSLTEQQLIDRQQGIGGSDIAAVMGIDPWRQPIDVFYDKRPDLAAEAGYVQRVVEGDAVDAGIFNEEGIAKMWVKKTGKKVRKSFRTLVHKKAHWLRANIDRDIVGERRGLEIKNVGMYMAPKWGPSGTDEAAEYYIPQVHQYMLVMDYDAWELAALIGGSDFRTYPFERDPEMDELILDISRDFWTNHVEAGIAPDIDPDHPTAFETIKRVYSLVNTDEIILPDNAVHWHSVKEQAAEERKRYQSIEDNAKAHLAALSGNAGRVRIPGVKGAYLREQRHRKATVIAESDFIIMRYSSRVK